MTQYHAIWGVNASVTEEVKQNPWIDLFVVKDDYSGMVVQSLSEGEDPFTVDLTWNKVTTIKIPSIANGTDMDILPSLVAPNTVQLVYFTNDGLTDVNFLKFTGIGIQVSP